MPDQVADAASLPPRHRAPLARPGAGGAILCIVFAAIIVAHAGLLPLSRWQADEYLYDALLRQGGWRFVADRFVHWAPRPWSELLLWGYGEAVIQARHPMSSRFVALLWAGLGLACISPALARSPRRLHLLAVGMGLFALYLLGHPVAEIFFWPSGAAAYLPTLAAITWLFWCCAIPDRPMPVGQAGLALLLTAGCSELGLFFAVAFAGCACVLAVRRGPRAYVWILPGLALAALDLWFLLHGRAGAGEQPVAVGPQFHHAWPSLWQGVLGLPAEMLAADEAGSGHALLQAASWMCAGLAGRWCLALPRRRAGDLAALVAALVLTAVLSRAAAFYQFGALCCQRHETMRHCLVLLACVAAGAWSGAIRPPRRANRPAFGLAMLGLAAALLLGPRMSGLIATYGDMPPVLSARAATWRSGLAPGTEMTFTMEPGSPLLPELGGFAPGTTRLDQAPPWYDRGVMLFFGKRVLRIVRPGR